VSNPTILLVEDNQSSRETWTAVLTQRGFEVTAVGSVKDALQCIAGHEFDVLLSDLHVPNTGDGFTVVSAMRHTNPRTITILFSAFPDLNKTVAAIILQADEVLLRPVDAQSLFEVIEDRLLNRRMRFPTKLSPVADILERETFNTIENWVTRAANSPDLQSVKLEKQERIEHLPMIFALLVDRLRQPHRLEEPAAFSQPAHDHGCLRWKQGYSIEMMVEESRMLQVSIFQTLQNNLASIDFTLVLVDIMAIADEVDSQLRQQVISFTAAQEKSRCDVSSASWRSWGKRRHPSSVGGRRGSGEPRE
jgi:DNA-binding response OmpR family regulator